MKKILIVLTASIFLLSACEKYLDLKPDKKLAVPKTLTDAGALLDNTFLNTNSGLGEAQADNYYMSQADWSALTGLRDRNVYIWQNDAVDGDTGGWGGRYNSILTVNVVLDLLDNYNPLGSDAGEFNRIYGAALFIRAYNFNELLHLFSRPFDKTTSATDPGISIRLSPDVNQKTTRASVIACYQQILSDLKRSITLLPTVTLVPTRPGKAAAYGAIANVYLSMEDYPNAALYADSSLQINSALIDYNTLTATADVPFVRFNKEVIYHANGSSTQLTSARAKIDPVLYDSYQPNDLRKAMFFKQNADKSYAFKGSYDGQNSSSMFTGLTTAEMYLVRAEAYSRINKTADALKDLNTLMVNRW
ncbi:MAG: RagB/SusD family nutrient uptake outer membrane protein, partial [Daejeonella sp.]